MPLVLVQPGYIKANTTEYFAVCGLAGIFSCGLTHCGVTPIDMVKCNKQNNPQIFNQGMIGNMRILAGIKGARGLVRGWAPTFVGYSFQGLGKFGLNDVFKYQYTKLLGEDFKANNPKIYYAMCSGSAEFFADILLCPWETVKLKVQTVDVNNWLEGKSNGYARGLVDGSRRLISEEGLGGAFQILKLLWARQIPYTIIKFVAFEDFIRRIYGFTESQFGKVKSDYNPTQQLAFTFLAGYGAGIFCGAVSHPADTMASLLSKSPGSAMGEVYAGNGGFGGLWKGFGARVFMIGTLTGLQWFIYDTTKVAFGLKTGGGKK
jgi:solute carrier family 25 phosphate transporter 3